MPVIELTIAAAITGVAVIGITLIRAKRMRRFTELLEYIEGRFDVGSLDLSGETEYADCVAQEWVLDNVAKKTYGRVTKSVLSFLGENTLLGTIAISLFAGISSILLGLFFVQGSVALGGAAGMFLVGGLVMMGPNEPRTSEQLLDALIAKKNLLCERDYVYARLAFDSIRSWNRKSALFGIAMLLMAPWAEQVPGALAASIATVVGTLIIGPAMEIAQYNAAAAISYLVVMVVLVFYFIPRTIWKALSRHPSEEDEVHMSQW